jgi:hypothetical protein
LAKIFISHAAADGELAAAVARVLVESQPPLGVFLSSRPGDIRADAEWLPAVQAALIEASAFLILLTPNSISRPWVSFETGVAWYSGRPFVLARTSQLSEEEIPLPTSARQIYRIDQADELSIICHALGTKSKDPDAAAATLRAIPLSDLAGMGEHAWEGIVFDGQYYAWAGALLCRRAADRRRRFQWAVTSTCNRRTTRSVRLRAGTQFLGARGGTLVC